MWSKIWHSRYGLYIKENKRVFALRELDKNDIKESNIDSIFNNISTFDEKYVTYYVHIVRENDTIDSICSKYGIDIAILKEYNNTEQITLGSKIIVPYIQSETI